jgi:hypothetical protein
MYIDNKKGLIDNTLRVVIPRGKGFLMEGSIGILLLFTIP